MVIKMFKINLKTQLFILMIVIWMVCGVVSAAMTTLTPIIIAAAMTFFYFVSLEDMKD